MGIIKGVLIILLAEWVRNKTPESLVKSLPYYKQRIITS